MKSPVMRCLPSRSRITSPTEVDVDLRKLKCLKGEESALHLDSLAISVSCVPDTVVALAVLDIFLQLV
jgi:hypothetical protein